MSVNGLNPVCLTFLVVKPLTTVQSPKIIGVNPSVLGPFNLRDRVLPTQVVKVCARGRGTPEPTCRPRLWGVVHGAPTLGTSVGGGEGEGKDVSSTTVSKGLTILLKKTRTVTSRVGPTSDPALVLSSLIPLHSVST